MNAVNTPHLVKLRKQNTSVMVWWQFTPQHDGVIKKSTELNYMSSSDN